MYENRGKITNPYAKQEKEKWKEGGHTLPLCKYPTQAVEGNQITQSLMDHMD